MPSKKARLKRNVIFFFKKKKKNTNLPAIPRAVSAGGRPASQNPHSGQHAPSALALAVPCIIGLVYPCYSNDTGARPGHE